MATQSLTVCVVGAGHIGLPLAAVLAEAGYRVVGYDTNDEFVARVNATGRVDFREEGLEVLLARHLHRDLTLTATPPAGLDVYMITVGTPLDPATGRPNLERVREATRQIAVRSGPDPLVVLRSTVTVGTTRDIVEPELRGHLGRFGLAFCPERTIEGRAIPEMRALPQIVGGLDEASADRAEALFRTITRTVVRVSSLEAAEAVKLVNNTYRDLTFAFANEVAAVAERLGLVAREVIRAANLDYPRAGVPRPGFVGGPCLEKDAELLLESVRRRGGVATLAETARRVNGALPVAVADRVADELVALGRPVAGAKVLVAGFAFKGTPPTEDVRGSAAIPLMGRLQARGAEVWGHDFVVGEKAIGGLGARSCGLEEGFAGADAVIVANDHPGYAAIDVVGLAATMRRPGVLFDAWSAYDPEQFRAVPGLRHGALGRGFRTA